MSALAQGPFATAALRLRSYGLAPIPCSAKHDGKVPGIRTKNWKAPPGLETLRQLALRFPEENIGILTGLSRVTVVDVDQANLAADMTRRFGNTPLVVETPSGGIHLYYRSSGERCANLRKPEGLPVDIKALGGFVVVPPSVRPSGPHAGKLYRFAEGSWDDVAHLPAMKPGSLPTRPTAQPGARQRDPRSVPASYGARNDTLFRLARREALACDNLDDLLDAVRGINESYMPPLPDGEVERIAKSAWRYQLAGRNFAQVGRQVFSYVSEIEAFRRAKYGSDAMLLLTVLRLYHFDGEPFAVAPIAMAAKGVIAGWTKHRYRNALMLLVELEIVSVVQPGGRGKGDPALYRITGHAEIGSTDRWGFAGNATLKRRN